MNDISILNNHHVSAVTRDYNEQKNKKMPPNWSGTNF